MKVRQAKKIYNNLIVNKCKYSKQQIDTACHIVVRYYIHYKELPEPKQYEFFANSEEKKKDNVVYELYAYNNGEKVTIGYSENMTDEKELEIKYK